MQERLIFQPNSGRIDPITAPADYQLPDMQEADITTRDNVRLRVWYQAPAQKNHPIMLFWHGNTGHVAHVGAPKPGEDYHPEYRLQLIREAIAQGYGIVHVHPRGYGNSQIVSPSEAGMWHDVRAANDFCVHKLTIPSNQLIIIGESLGACHVLMTASDMKERYNSAPLAVLIAPFHSIAKKIEENHPDIPVEKAVKKLRHRLDNSEYLSHLDDNTHVLVITPANDTTTAPWHSELLVEQIQTLNLPHSHHLLDDAGHITWNAHDVIKSVNDVFKTLE